jgi:hypothetical protein
MHALTFSLQPKPVSSSASLRKSSPAPFAAPDRSDEDLYPKSRGLVQKKAVSFGKKKGGL